jgi:hypothetical protein
MAGEGEEVQTPTEATAPSTHQVPSSTRIVGEHGDREQQITHVE